MQRGPNTQLRYANGTRLVASEKTNRRRDLLFGRQVIIMLLLLFVQLHFARIFWAWELFHAIYLQLAKENKSLAAGYSFSSSRFAPKFQVQLTQLAQGAHKWNLYHDICRIIDGSMLRRENWRQMSFASLHNIIAHLTHFISPNCFL